MDYGIIQHASVRLWMVCTEDVYLPETKCLTVIDGVTKRPIPAIDPNNPDPLNSVNVTVINTPNARSEEFLVDLPLAYFVPPISTTPGQLPLILDLEDKRMTEFDGLCSLRLREPCVFEGVRYEGVVAVQATPVLSVLSANETSEAESLVQDILDAALNFTEGGQSPPPPPPEEPLPGISPTPAPEISPAPGPSGSTGSPPIVGPPGGDLLEGAPEAQPAEGPAAGPGGLSPSDPLLPPLLSPSPDLISGAPTLPGGLEPALAPAGEPPIDIGFYGPPPPPTGALPEESPSLEQPGAPSPAPGEGPAPAPESSIPGGIEDITDFPPEEPLLPPESPALPGQPRASPPPPPQVEQASPPPPEGGAANASPPPPEGTTGTRPTIGRRLASLASMVVGLVRPARRLQQDLLTGSGTTSDPLLEAAAGGNLISDALVDPSLVDIRSLEAPAAQQVYQLDPTMLSLGIGANNQPTFGSDLPAPQITDNASLPPLLTENMQDPTTINADVIYDDFFISWLPFNTSNGELCLMTNSADLPEAFLQGIFSEVEGYDEDCTPESLPEVSGEEYTPLSKKGHALDQHPFGQHPPLGSKKLTG